MEHSRQLTPGLTPSSTESWAISGYYINVLGQIDSNAKPTQPEQVYRPRRSVRQSQYRLDFSGFAQYQEMQRQLQRNSQRETGLDTQNHTWRVLPIDKLSNLERAGQTVRLANPQKGWDLTSFDPNLDRQFDFLKNKKSAKLLGEASTAQRSLTIDEALNASRVSKELPEIQLDIDPELRNDPYSPEYEVKLRNQIIYDEFGDIVSKQPILKVRSLSSRYGGDDIRKLQLPNSHIQHYLDLNRPRRAGTISRLNTLSKPKKYKMNSFQKAQSEERSPIKTIRPVKIDSAFLRSTDSALRKTSSLAYIVKSTKKPPRIPRVQSLSHTRMRIQKMPPLILRSVRTIEIAEILKLFEGAII